MAVVKLDALINGRTTVFRNFQAKSFPFPHVGHHSQVPSGFYIP